MKRKKRHISKIFIGLGLILGPFVYFSTPMQLWRGQNPVFSAVNHFISAGQASIHSTIIFVQDIWHNYIFLVDTQKINDQVKDRIELLESKTQNYEALKAEIDYYRNMLNLSSKLPYDLVAAEVIASSNSPSFRSFRLDKGFVDGIELGMPVLNHRGVIGKIIRVYQNSSDVQLLTDINFYLDTLIERIRVRALIKGSDDHRCHLQIRRDVDIKVGDTLITSGFIGSFPRGLEVGRVVEISFDADQISQSIIIEPWVDADQIDKAFVMKISDKNINKISKASHLIKEVENAETSLK